MTHNEDPNADEIRRTSDAKCGMEQSLRSEQSAAQEISGVLCNLRCIAVLATTRDSTLSEPRESTLFLQYLEMKTP